MFTILRAKIGEQEAKALTDYVASEVTNRFEAHKDVLATKEDVRIAVEKISDKIEGIYKWMIGLFIPLYLSIIGLIITLLLRHG